ncbi:bacterial Ig-like domain family protein [Vibrio sp. HENC-03]|uniref:bacterial Ig-like domain family protein n=1 Tax=Vibrio sp. HENC-03 TaxID=992012 RepID=UPI00028D3192|nr:bacterial Ig-like domain family protein [Vibrio sp. HENC-03]EKM24931.1 bacterial Ig-like domain family protein [Vibrio sp. HENC-03]
MLKSRDNQNRDNRKHPYALIAAIALAGCNGEGDKKTDNGSPDYMVPASISAQNATFITDYQDSYVVDLSDKVSVDGGKSFTLLEVTSLNNVSECQPLETMTHSFTIAARNAKSCDYEYKVAVTNASVKSASIVRDALAPIGLMGAPTDVAITRVAVMSEMPVSSLEVTLPAVSAVTFEEQLVEVDIRDLLLAQAGIMVPFNFTLSEELSLPYNPGYSTAEADPLRNTIIYTPFSGFEGIERILFSYKNDDTGEVLLGTLDIAVTTEANDGLFVEDDIIYSKVFTNQIVTIDIAPYITSYDGDDYQLIHVDSFNAATEPFDPDDLSNKQFTFETSQVGNHYVSFAVTDNNGAYALGLMEVPVTTPDGLLWDDVYINNTWYTKPLTTSQATGDSLLYSSFVSDSSYNPTVDIALSSLEQAVSYCGTKGQLPLREQMTTLFEKGLKDSYNWPTTGSYWLNDNGVYKVMDMETGVVNTASSEGNYITSCIINDFTVSKAEEETVANGISKSVVSFKLVSGPMGQPVEGESIAVTVESASGNAIADNTSLVTGSEGNASLTVSSITSETVEVCGSTPSKVENACTYIWFVADKATAKITDVESNIAGWEVGNEKQYPVYITVSDANGNPVKDAIVNVEVIEDDFDNALVFPFGGSAKTNESGLAELFMRNDETNAYDRSYIRLSHVNTDFILSEEFKVINWGGWQWQTPLEVKLSPRNDRTRECSELMGSDEWRYLTDAEVSEYLDAVQNGGLDFSYGEMKGTYSPISLAIVEKSQSSEGVHARSYAGGAFENVFTIRPIFENGSFIEYVRLTINQEEWLAEKGERVGGVGNAYRNVTEMSTSSVGTNRMPKTAAANISETICVRPL